LVFGTYTCYLVFVPNTLVLIQVRIPEKLAKKLDKARKSDGVITRAEYLRQIVSAFIESKEKKDRN